MTEANPSVYYYNKNEPDSSVMASNTLTSTNAPLNPFDRLPTELLADIFFHVVESPLHYSRTEESDWTNSKWADSPRLPSSVCRRWRSIAFSTPRLWVSVCVKFKEPMEGGYERTLLRQWLERSGRNAISLEIGPIYDHFGVDPFSPVEMALQNITDDLTGIILSVLHRCKAIHIGSGKGVLDLRKIQDHFVNGMPSLRELYIDSEFSGDMDLRSSFRLEAFIDTAYRNVFSQYRFGEVHFHALRRLKTSGSVNDLYHILQHFSSLTECTFTISHQEAPLIDVALGAGPSVRPALESLDVNSDSDDSVVDSWCIWERFRFPSLKRLCIAFVGLAGEGDRHWASFYSFIKQSRPPLEDVHLIIVDVGVSEVQLNEVLSSLPTLKRLALSFCGDPEFDDTIEFDAIMPSLWQHLHDSERPLDNTQSEGTSSADQSRNFSLDRPRVCPLLEDLYIDTNDCMKHRLDDVAGFILSRCPPSYNDFYSSTSPSSGINWRVLYVRVGACGFTLDEFLRYPGIDECLRNGLEVFYSRFKQLVATSEFLWIFLLCLRASS